MAGLRTTGWVCFFRRNSSPSQREKKNARLLGKSSQKIPSFQHIRTDETYATFGSPAFFLFFSQNGSVYFAVSTKQPEDLHRDLICPPTVSLITDPTDNCSLFQAALTAIFVKVEGAFTQAQMPLGLALYLYIPRPPCITKATSRCLKSSFLSQSPPPLPTCPHLQHQRVIFSSCFTPSSDSAAWRPAGLRSPSPEMRQ